MGRLICFPLPRFNTPREDWARGDSCVFWMMTHFLFSNFSWSITGVTQTVVFLLPAAARRVISCVLYITNTRRLWKLKTERHIEILTGMIQAVSGLCPDSNGPYDLFPWKWTTSQPQYPPLSCLAGFFLLQLFMCYDVRYEGNHWTQWGQKAFFIYLFKIHVSLQTLSVTCVSFKTCSCNDFTTETWF